MFNIGLTEFGKTPWTTRIKETMFNALIDNKNVKCEKLLNYPNKKYDILILCGIRSITKKKLDVNLLRKFSRILIEIGDDGIDGQRTHEDYFFYFVPTKKPLFEHYLYLPKFVNENYLYPEKTEKISVFIDHYKHQTEREKEISIRSILYIFENLKKFRNEIDIYFHSSKGIELNPQEITIPANKKDNFKYIDFKEISKYYRKCHIFFPTHRESQGMLAQEIGACGGLTIMQKWMYPLDTHYQFEHLLYDFEKFVDLENIFKICRTKEFIDKNRNKVIKNCSIKLFNKVFLEKINFILSKHF